jgi:hypothetical protein
VLAVYGKAIQVSRARADRLLARADGIVVRSDINASTT